VTEFYAEVFDENGDNRMVTVSHHDPDAFMWCLAQTLRTYVARDIVVEFHPDRRSDA